MNENQRILKWLGVILIIMSLIWWISAFRSFYIENIRLRGQVDRLQYTLAHSTIGLQRDTIRDSIPVVKQQVVTIDKTNYKKMEADKKLIKDLNLKISQIESEMRLLIANQGHVTLQAAKDSDSILWYKDKWCEFEYLVKQKELYYKTLDSLVTYIDREYKHKILFGLIKWGTKGYNITHVNFNPNADIKYSRYIKVERK